MRVVHCRPLECVLYLYLSVVPPSVSVFVLLLLVLTGSIDWLPLPFALLCSAVVSLPP